MEEKKENNLNENQNNSKNQEGEKIIEELKSKQNDESIEELEKEIKEHQEKKEKKGFFKSKDDKLKERIEELEKQNEELKSDYLRARADFENYRKRMQKELEEARERAITSFVLDILPSIDNFEMSLKMTDNKEMFIKGVHMIHSNLINVLNSNHYEQFSPEIGEEFNPIKHDPILIEADAEPGKVLNVLQIGYKRKDNIIRPARVQIAKEKDN